MDDPAERVAFLEKGHHRLPTSGPSSPPSVKSASSSPPSPRLRAQRAPIIVGTAAHLVEEGVGKTPRTWRRLVVFGLVGAAVLGSLGAVTKSQKVKEWMPSMPGRVQEVPMDLGGMDIDILEDLGAPHCAEGHAAGLTASACQTCRRMTRRRKACRPKRARRRPQSRHRQRLYPSQIAWCSSRSRNTPSCPCPHLPPPSPYPTKTSDRIPDYPLHVQTRTHDTSPTLPTLASTINAKRSRTRTSSPRCSTGRCSSHPPGSAARSHGRRRVASRRSGTRTSRPLTVDASTANEAGPPRPPSTRRRPSDASSTRAGPSSSGTFSST